MQVDPLLSGGILIRQVMTLERLDDLNAIADPNLVRKTREGRADEVRPCIACNQGCIGGIFRANRMGCTVNAAVGAEATMSEELLVPVDRPKRVLVVGGGPAGLEAARVAALKGHKVRLVEAQNRLGGAVNLAKKAPALLTLGDITDWLEREVARLGVEMCLNTFLEADEIRASDADVVIIATGSEPRLDGFQLADPGEQVEGCDLPHVLSTHALFSGARLPDRGAHALVFDTVGHYEALAAVDTLMQRGLAVTFVTSAVSMSPYVQTTWRDVPALERFHRLGSFEALVRHRLERIEDGACIIRPRQAPTDKVRRVTADVVVLVTHNKPLRGLYEELREEREGSIFVIGDASAPRDVQVAIAEGNQLARAIG